MVFSFEMVFTLCSTPQNTQRETIFPTSQQLAHFHLFSIKAGKTTSEDSGNNLTKIRELSGNKETFTESVGSQKVHTVFN